MANGHGGKREGSGREPHKPTPKLREQVMIAVSMGLDQEHIAPLVGVSVPTLRKHYAEQLEHGANRANLNVSARLYRKATREGDTGALIWWTKARMKWSEKIEQEHSGHLNIDGAKDDLAASLARTAAATGAAKPPSEGST